MRLWGENNVAGTFF